MSRLQFHRYALLLIAVLLCAVNVTLAQPSLTINRVVNNWPIIELDFNVTCNGQQQYGFDKSNINIVENGVLIDTPFTLICPPSNGRCAISVGLVFDVSGSMGGQNIAGAKAAGLKFIDNMDGTIDEAAITAFNADPWVVQSMTTIKPLLYNAVNGLNTGGIGDVWDGIYTGLLAVESAGVNPCRAVVAVVDGRDFGSSNTTANIISFASRYRIKVFPVAIEGGSVDRSDLMSIAQLSGGKYYETSDPSKLSSIYDSIFTKITREYLQGCIVTYPATCSDGGLRTVDLTINFCNGSDTKTKTYRAPRDSSTFVPMNIEIGKTYGFQNYPNAVPVVLKDQFVNTVIHPAIFDVKFNQQEMQFQSIQMPQGSLLEGVPFQTQVIAGGIRVLTMDRKLVNGSGVLFEILMKTDFRSLTDSLCSELTIEDWVSEAGCFNVTSVSEDVCFVPAIPRVTVSGSTTLCPDSTIVLSANLPFSDLRWSTGDRVMTISVSSPGSYWFTGKNTSGQTVVSDTIHVTRVTVPRARLDSAGAILICAQTTYRAGITGDYLYYKWNTGDTTKSIEIRTAGKYWAEVTHASGCPSRTDTLEVKVAPELSPIINGLRSACPGKSTTYITPTSSGVTYEWHVTGGVITGGAGTESVVILWNETGNGKIQLKVTHVATGCFLETEAMIQLSGSLTPTITTVGSTTFCAGDSLVLDAGSLYDSYAWSTGEKTQSIVVRTAGMYWVNVSRDECQGTSDTVTVNVLPLPTPTVTGRTAVCEGEETVLDAGSGFASYRWNTGDTTQTIRVNRAGVFNVVVTSQDGCRGTSSDVLVTVLPAPAQPIISRTGDLLAATPAIGYQWYRNDTLIPGATQQTYLVLVNGVYKVAITDANGCRSVSEPLNVITDIREFAALKSFILHQNYPNPFNPTTVIEFELPVATHARLAVFDVLGREVRELVNERRDAGLHRIPFNADGLPGGVYTYRLEVRGKVIVRQMVVVK